MAKSKKRISIEEILERWGFNETQIAMYAQQYHWSVQGSEADNWRPTYREDQVQDAAAELGVFEKLPE